MNKILLIFYGGTGLYDKKEKIIYVEKQQDLEKWLSKVPEISLMAKIDTLVIEKNRELISQNNIIKIVNEIKTKIDNYDGIIILNEPDSIPTLANKLFWLIQYPNKPIVITGSNVIEKDGEFVPDLSFKANLINAFQAINSQINEISVLYGNKVIKASRVIRKYLTGLNIYDSIDQTYLAKIDFGLSTEYKSKNNQKTKYYNKLNNGFVFFEQIPEVDFLKDVFKNDKINALIFNALPNQIANREQLITITKLIQENKKIAIFYSDIGFAMDFFEYTIITISKITQDCLSAKLSWILGQTKNEEKIRKLLKQNIQEEFFE